jgi:Spy/CpxP family protein refolding chaperone
MEITDEMKAEIQGIVKAETEGLQQMLDDANKATDEATKKAEFLEAESKQAFEKRDTARQHAGEIEQTYQQQLRQVEEERQKILQETGEAKAKAEADIVAMHQDYALRTALQNQGITSKAKIDFAMDRIERDKVQFDENHNRS